jgi:hypothetical protein
MCSGNGNIGDGEPGCTFVLFLVPRTADDGGTVADEGIEKRSFLTSKRDRGRLQLARASRSITFWPCF